MFNPLDSCDVIRIDLNRVRRLRALVDDGTVSTLAETFRALGDPTRVRILDALSARRALRLRLAAVLGLSQSPSRTSCGCCAGCTWCGRGATAA